MRDNQEETLSNLMPANDEDDDQSDFLDRQFSKIDEQLKQERALSRNAPPHRTQPASNRSSILSNGGSVLSNSQPVQRARWASNQLPRENGHMS
jgi:hypothetical protein